jgi:hypothetical protein
MVGLQCKLCYIKEYQELSDGPNYREPLSLDRTVLLLAFR